MIGNELARIFNISFDQIRCPEGKAKLEGKEKIRGYLKKKFKPLDATGKPGGKVI